MLNIKNITKTFRDRKILDSVNLHVRRGEIAVLLGSSGVGKSTLLRILNNLESIDHGSVFLDDKELDLKTVNKTHVIGMVFQHFNLFEHLTVEQNITLPLEQAAGKSPREAKMIAHTLLKQYGLLEKADTYVSQLSGGQKQRLAIARTLALKPQIICLDEPTSALDPLLTSYVANAIKELADKGYIVLVATHDTTLLERLPCTIYLMKEGKIIESATSEDFYKHKEKYPNIARFVSGKE
jgi:polar amino acid transport system ATP-binding protein